MEFHETGTRPRHIALPPRSRVQSPKLPRNPTASRGPVSVTPGRAPAMPALRAGQGFPGLAGKARNVLLHLAFGLAGVAMRPICRGARRLPFFHAGLLGVEGRAVSGVTRVMETLDIKPQDQRIARLKLGIIRQQELAAKLVREGKAERARQARAKLLAMLNELDVLEERAVLSVLGGRAA